MEQKCAGSLVGCSELLLREFFGIYTLAVADIASQFIIEERVRVSGIDGREGA